MSECSLAYSSATSASTLRFATMSDLLPANAITTFGSPRRFNSRTHDLAPSNESCVGEDTRQRSSGCA